MAEPFKNLVSAGSALLLGTELSRAIPSFPVARFVAAAADGLDDLELKARVRHVGTQLRPFLADDWPTALDQLVAAMPQEAPNHEGATSFFHWWPVLDVVERDGLSHPEASVRALCRLTTRFSAEFAIRPYLIRAPDITWPLLEGWVDHVDPNVRRWVSEGTRPRLPWGIQLATSIADPARGLRLLDRLVDDPSAYVRRSVANHLGDVAKDHPALAVVTAQRWLAVPTRHRLVEHGLRTLFKRGDAGALALIGNVGGSVRVVRVGVTPASARVGGSVVIHAELVNPMGGSVRVDVVWEWPGARGGWSRKIFRGGTRALKADETWNFEHRLSLREVSTRPSRPGEQRLSLRVNGEDGAAASFLLEP
ncbi:DNA alkylation repair protein [Deltaproteobacteria bacterium]|nr:DNA alkylation repair protein [Deltaproteobacteria bacterium]